MTSTARIARRAITWAALSCAGVLATACGSGAGAATGPTAGPAKTSPVTAVAGSGRTASTPASPSSPASPAPATQPAAPGGAAGCTTRSLQAKVGPAQGAAGSTYTVLDFTNVSAVSCTLYGYPGVSLADGTPVTQLGLPAAENPAAARQLVTLKPGATGNALLQIAAAGNYPAASCHPVTAHYLQIYPPNQTTPLYLAYTSATCAKPVRTMTIGVVKPGSGGSS